MPNSQSEGSAPTTEYDVFLAYNSHDGVAARTADAIYRALKERGKNPYYDQDHVENAKYAGLAVDRIMETAIAKSRCCAVIVGVESLGRWQGAFEVTVGRLNAVQRAGFRTYAVRLPGVELSELPAALTGYGMVDLREGISDEGLTDEGLSAIMNAVFPEEASERRTEAAAVIAVPRNRALLIGVSEYQNPGLATLNGPLQDIPLLEEALKDANMRAGGHWEVEALDLNPDNTTLGEAVQSFFRAPETQGGTALFYYSGHGVVGPDTSGVTQSFLCASNTNTDVNSLVFTAISATQIAQLVENCPAASKIVILDCCHGAPISLNAYDDLGEDVAVVLASRGATDDGEESEPSPFTRNLEAIMRDPDAYRGDGLTIGALVAELRRRGETPSCNTHCGNDILLAASTARPEQATDSAGDEGIGLSVEVLAAEVPDDRLLLIRQLAATLDGLLAVARDEGEVPSSVVSESMQLLADELRHVAGSQLDPLHELVEANADKLTTCRVRFADENAQERLSGLPWEFLALCDRRRDVLVDPRIAVERVFQVAATKGATVTSVQKVALLSSLAATGEAKQDPLSARTEEQLKNGGIAVEAVSPAQLNDIGFATPDADVVALMAPVRLLEETIWLMFADNTWKRAAGVSSRLGDRRNLTCLLIETIADSWGDVSALAVRMLARDLASDLKRPVVAICHPRAYLDCIEKEPGATTFLAHLLRELANRSPLGHAASAARKGVLDSLGGDPAIVGIPIVMQPVPREESPAQERGRVAPRP